MRRDWMAWAYAQESVTSSAAIAVLLAIAKHADEAGFCFPSVDRISLLTRLDSRTVQRQVKALEALGLVRREVGGGLVQKSGDKNQGRASSYQLVDEPVPTAAQGETTPAQCRPRSETTPAQCHPRSQTTPAQCHPRNPAKSTIPRHSVTLTEVRETEGGGGSARAPLHGCEPARGPTLIALPKPEPGGSVGNVIAPDEFEDRTRREELLAAMGHENPNAISVRGRIAGNRDDMAEVQRWTVDLGLTHAEQLSVVRDAMATKRDPGPPTTFSYFTKPMARLAGEKARPCLQPIYPTENTRERANATSRKRNQIPAYVLIGARGTTD